MRSALNPQDASRLVKVCGLLASDQVGERASAALQVTRIMERLGLTWAELFASTSPEAEPNSTPRYGRGAPRDLRHRPVALWALTFPAMLSNWERDFLASISRKRRISERERRKLAEIAVSLRERGAA